MRNVGPISIDLVHDRLEVRGRKVAVTPSEFKVLALLASDPGTVFTRRQIMERLWDSTHTGDEHAARSTYRASGERSSLIRRIRAVS